MRGKRAKSNVPKVATNARIAAPPPPESAAREAAIGLGIASEGAEVGACQGPRHRCRNAGFDFWTQPDWRAHRSGALPQPVPAGARTSSCCSRSLRCLASHVQLPGARLLCCLRNSLSSCHLSCRRARCGTGDLNGLVPLPSPSKPKTSLTLSTSVPLNTSRPCRKLAMYRCSSVRRSPCKPPARPSTRAATHRLATGKPHNKRCARRAALQM